MKSPQGAADLTPAPGELSLVQAFLNTADLEAGTDGLATPKALAEWLVRHRLLVAGSELSEADRLRAVEVREGWRSMFAGSPSEELAQTLDRATEAAALRLRHGPDGALWFEALASGLDGTLARLLAIVLQAQVAGNYRRLKICASRTCRAVFYDRSDNLSKRWCRPRCGNRETSKRSKRRSRASFRRTMEAKRQNRRLAVKYREPSLSELEEHPELGDLARRVRETEEGH